MTSGYPCLDCYKYIANRVKGVGDLSASWIAAPDPILPAGASNPNCERVICLIVNEIFGTYNQLCILYQSHPEGTV